ncbi:hypothetical protein SNEBB_008301 [Seison nebaliae]|nr:hypothetical protein SNEBB_008301 [Seison nebaliae]
MPLLDSGSSANAHQYINNIIVPILIDYEHRAFYGGAILPRWKLLPSCPVNGTLIRVTACLPTKTVLYVS